MIVANFDFADPRCQKKILRMKDDKLSKSLSTRKMGVFTFQKLKLSISN